MALFRHRAGLGKIFRTQKWGENIVARVILNEGAVREEIRTILLHLIDVALIPAKDTFHGFRTIHASRL